MTTQFLKGQEALGYEPKQAYEFHQSAGYTAKKGDQVVLDPAVQGSVKPVADGQAVRGTVDVVYAPLQGAVRLTVALLGQRADSMTAKGAIAPNDDLVSAGGNTFRKYVHGTDDASAVVAFALTAAADGDIVELIYK